MTAIKFGKIYKSTPEYHKRISAMSGITGVDVPRYIIFLKGSDGLEYYFVDHPDTVYKTFTTSEDSIQKLEKLWELVEHGDY